MKKLYLFALVALAAVFVGCKSDNPNVVTPVAPTVSIEKGNETTDSISFTVTTTNAEACAYMLYEAAAPAANDVLANGTAIEVNKAVVVTIDELEADTQYNVAVAVRNGEKTEVATYAASTTAVVSSDPEVSIQAVGSTLSTITFSITSTNADKVAYVVTTGEAPETDLVLVNGVDVDVNTTVEVTVENLAPGTAYTVKAAARTGVVRVGSEAITITTLEAGNNEAPTEANCILKGAANGNTFELRMQTLDKKFIMNLTLYSQGAFLNIMPEATYVFDAEADSWSGSAKSDYWFYSEDMLGGTVVVKHLAEGYEVLVQGVMRGDTEANYLFTGIIEPSSSSAAMGNPPIPYNDTTYTPNITKVVGSHYQPSSYFNLAIYADNGYTMDISLNLPQDVQDGLIPDGRYTLGGDMELTAYSTMSFELDGAEAVLDLVEDSYLEVTQLERGYRIQMHAVNGLKTKIDATFEGNIETDPNQPYDFVNPGMVVEADIEVEFTSAQRAGDSNNGRGSVWSFSNDRGETAMLCFNKSKVTENGPEVGNYAIINAFEEWSPGYDPEAFQVSGNDSYVYISFEKTDGSTTMATFYPSPGMVYVTKDGDTYTIVYEATFYNSYLENVDDHYQILRWTYTGTL